MSKRTVVGWFEGRSDVVVYREPEVGIAWEAEAPHFNHAALGSTPEEAVKNLIGALSEKGISGRGYTDDAKMKKLEER